MANSIFANGTEYMVFDEAYCCNCKKYVPWHEATKNNPVCPIEDAIAMAQYDEKKFPYKYIKRDQPNEFSYCTEFEAEGANK